MKIIHAIFSFHVGGAETLLIDILNRQCQEASVDLIIVNDKVNPDLLHTIDPRIHVYLLNRKESNKIQLLSAFFKIKQIVKTIHPDIIHCHDNNLLPFFAGQRKKTCLTVHNVKRSALFLKHYRRVFAISTAVQEDIKKQTRIFAPIVYNGIETEQYKQRLSYAFDPEKETFQIVQLSRLYPEQKGQHIALQSIRILKDQHIDVKLYFVGGGASDELVRLKALAEEYGIENQIEFAGQKDREWVKNHLKTYHLLIQPSLYEGFGLTIIEGFACGLPVIASDLDGPKEICQVLHTGLLVQAKDPDDLAEKIQMVYQSYASHTLADENYILKDKNQMKIFDIQTTSKSYMDHYASLSILQQ